MANYEGTPGPDTVTVGPGDFFDGLAGDDVITLSAPGAGAQPGPGADRIVVTHDWPIGSAVFYWGRGPDFPAPVTVDLEAGYAIDGWGDRDVLVNVRDIHGAHRPGDRFLGSRFDDNFWAGNGFMQTASLVVVDGRGGHDTVNFGASLESGKATYSISADARLVRVTYENFPNHVFEFRNIERFYTNEAPGSDVYAMRRFDDLIDPGVVGAQTLLQTGTGKGWQTGALGNAVTLSFSFMTAVPSYGGGSGGTGFAALDSTAQQVVREALFKLSQQVGLNFIEMPAGQGQLQFGINQQANTRGYSFSPSEVTDQRAGDVWLDVETAAQLRPGNEGYYVLLHEIGHALGLGHPLPQTDTSGATVLLDRWYDLRYTIMLESAPVQALWPSWFGGFDLDALRHLYGKRVVAGGNDTYNLSDSAGRQMTALLDDGGSDTLSARDSTVSATIDLRPGKLNSIGLTLDGRKALDNFVIGAGTWIENVVGTVLDDAIIGNELSNRIRGGGGNDLIDGQGGVDWALFDAPMSQFTLTRSGHGGYWTVEGRDGVRGLTELVSVERVVFSDQRGMAYDTGADGAAGQAALLLGVLFGREGMLGKKELLGAVIDLIDQGLTLPILSGAVMRLKLDPAGTLGVFDALAGSSTPQAIATYLHRTVFGSDPSASQLAQAVATLTQQPEGTYLAQLAASAANQQQVGLAGLIDTGLEVVFPPLG